MGVIIKQSIRNTLFTYSGFALGAFNTMILMPAVMVKEQMGLLQSISSYTNIFTSFFTLGMPLALVKFYNDYRAKGQQSGLLLFSLLLPLGVFGVFSLFYFIFREQFLSFVAKEHSGLVDQYFDLAILMTFSSLIFEIFTSLLKNYFLTEAAVFLKELFLRIMNTLILGLCFFHVYDYHTLVYLYAGVFSSLGVLLMLYALYKTPHSLRNFSTLSGKRDLVSYGGYTLLNIGITYFVFQLDSVIIQKFLGLAPLAVYAIGLNISVLVQLPQRSLLPVMHGVIAKAFHENNMKELESVYKKSSLVMLLSGGFVISLLILGLPPVLYLLLPPEYTEGLVSVFIILCFAKYVDMLFGFNGYIILQSSYYRFEVWSGLTLLLICIGLNLLLIPPYGIDGAAFATVLGFLVYNIMRYIYIRRKFGIVPFTKDSVTAVLVTFLPLLLIVFIPFPDTLLFGIVKALLYLVLAGGSILWFRPSEDIHKVIQGMLNFMRKKNG